MTKLVEEWRPVVGFEGLYEVSDWGRVKSFPKTTRKSEKIIGRKRGDYYEVTLWKNKKEELRTGVHCLVAKAFIPNPNNYPIVNHKDENPSNNCVENLEWCTYPYNVTYGTAPARRREKMVGRKASEETKKKMSIARKGKKINQPINNAKSKEVYQYTMDGELVKIWPSTMECKRNGYNQGLVAECCRGGRWRKGKWLSTKSYKGYIWSYIPL